MMWKDSYRVGVEKIDQQHKELFDAVEMLVHELEVYQEWQPKQKFIIAFAFIKRYAREHFEYEEDYLASIHYSELEKHKKEHASFVDVMHQYETTFHGSGYDLRYIREFSGYLTSWLMYHVLESDRKAITGEVSKEAEIEAASYLECFAKSISYVFDTMFGIITSDILSIEEYQNIGSLHSTIEFVGDFKGEVTYSFSTDFACHMMRVMTGMEVPKMDDIVCSAMAEISNIVSGNASIELTKQGHTCDIRPPMIRTGPFRSNDNYLSQRCLEVKTAMGSLFLTIER